MLFKRWYSCLRQAYQIFIGRNLHPRTDTQRRERRRVASLSVIEMTASSPLYHTWPSTWADRSSTFYEVSVLLEREHIKLKNDQGLISAWRDGSVAKTQINAFSKKGEAWFRTDTRSFGERASRILIVSYEDVSLYLSLCVFTSYDRDFGRAVGWWLVI